MTTYLVATNVLLRWVDPTQALYPVARGAVRSLLTQGHDLVMAAQSVPQHRLVESLQQSFEALIALGVPLAMFLPGARKPVETG